MCSLNGAYFFVFKRQTSQFDRYMLPMAATMHLTNKRGISVREKRMVLANKKVLVENVEYS
jgi:hypothetical protein